MKNSMIENLNLGNLKIGSKTFCFLYTKMIVSEPTTRAVHESRQVLLKFLIFRILHFRIFKNSIIRGLKIIDIENWKIIKSKNSQIGMKSYQQRVLNARKQPFWSIEN